MASIYSTTDGHTITEGLQGCNICSEALGAAYRIAEARNETVHLEDDDGEWLVGPRGGVRKLTPALLRQYGLSKIA